MYAPEEVRGKALTDRTDHVAAALGRIPCAACGYSDWVSVGSGQLPVVRLTAGTSAKVLKATQLD